MSFSLLRRDVNSKTVKMPSQQRQTDSKEDAEGDGGDHQHFWSKHLKSVFRVSPSKFTQESTGHGDEGDSVGLGVFFHGFQSFGSLHRNFCRRRC